MRLILARHGNTFGAQDKVVRAGLTNDLALVERGFEQARAIGAYFNAHNITPAVAYAGGLRRQFRTAWTACESAGFSNDVIVDERLNEIDYGPWTGLTDDEIKAQFGEEGLRAWEEKSEWPAEWVGDADSLTQGIQDFVQMLLSTHGVDDTVFVVSSGGTLRYFLKLVEGAFEDAIANHTLKVKTGHLCQLTHDGKQWTLDFWNKDPEA